MVGCRGCWHLRGIIDRRLNGSACGVGRGGARGRRSEPIAWVWVRVVASKDHVRTAAACGGVWAGRNADACGCGRWAGCDHCRERRAPCAQQPQPAAARENALALGFGDPTHLLLVLGSDQLELCLEHLSRLAVRLEERLLLRPHLLLAGRDQRVQLRHRACVR
jgi:hypothetical protein